MRTYKVEAVVVKKRNFLEKDRVLTLFSKEKGKIEALSKGSRRPGSRLSSYSDIGARGIYYLHGTRSIDIVKEIKPIFMPEGARGEYLKTNKIGYLFKVIDKVFERDVSHLRTYRALIMALEIISEHEFQLPFIAFLAQVIIDMGLKPELFSCLICAKRIRPNERVGFSAQGGLCHVACTDSLATVLTENEIKFLRLIFNSPFEKIVKSKVEEKIFKKTDLIIADYFRWNFGEILPDPIT